jgi:excisionase family DNA binding protein
MITTSHGTPAAAVDGAADDRLFMTVEEVGRLLGVRRSRVYELAARGILPVVRIGRRIRFPRRGLEGLADEAIARAKADLAGEEWAGRAAQVKGLSPAGAKGSGGAR